MSGVLLYLIKQRQWWDEGQVEEHVDGNRNKHWRMEEEEEKNKRI